MSEPAMEKLGDLIERTHRGDGQAKRELLDALRHLFAEDRCDYSAECDGEPVAFCECCGNDHCARHYIVCMGAGERKEAEPDNDRSLGLRRCDTGGYA